MPHYLPHFLQFSQEIEYKSAAMPHYSPQFLQFSQEI